MAHDVVLISNDASLASMVQTVIPTPGTLRILRSSSELPAEPEFGAETVVLDLPADIRLAARTEVRRRYSGRLLVALSSEAEAEGWPDDPACRFLIRPFRVEEVGEALRAPVPEPQTAAPPARPEPAEIGAAAAPPALSPRPGTPGTPATPATPGAPFPEASAGPAGPAGPVTPAPQASGVEDEGDGNERATDLLAEPEAARPRGGGRRRRLLTVLTVLVVLILAVVAAFGGVAIGRTSVDLEHRSASVGSTQGSAAPAPVPSSTAAHSSQAAACADAMDQADAAISYLVQGVNDQRLSDAMQHYHVDRGACLGKPAG
jgi:hypothetical protein